MDRPRKRKKEIDVQHWEKIESAELSAALAKSQKWKSPGADQIQNFWLYSRTPIHDPLAHCLTNIMQNPDETPDWLTEGITYLLPKSQETKNPKNYRPITCLSTIYKLLTSILTNRIHSFLEQNSVLPQEQKGCKRNSYGCKDQLFINKMILENCRQRKRNLSTAWIEYSKAFDSVSHEWILTTLQLYKISPTISNFLQSSMAKWKTRLFLSHNNGIYKSDFLHISRGIFQGDSPFSSSLLYGPYTFIK